MTKYIACATRRNIDNKPDYTWTEKYTNGLPVLFDTEADALYTAERACYCVGHALYNPRAEIYQQ